MYGYSLRKEVNMNRKTGVGAITILVFLITASTIVSFYLINQNQNTKPIQSLSGVYLPDSRIFVVSANATYGNYPFPTVTNLPYGPDGRL
jgi:hypothetical protein